jgi:hypothetical protein
METKNALIVDSLSRVVHPWPFVSVKINALIKI